MSQYSERFNEMLGGNSVSKVPVQKSETHFETPGHSRALRFVWPDGKRTFIQYFHLGKSECSADFNTLTLFLSGETVTLLGRNLHLLWEEISQQLVREISIVEARYLELEEPKDWVVSEIKFEST